MTVSHLTVGRIGHPIHVCLHKTYQANVVTAWIIPNMIFIVGDRIFTTVTLHYYFLVAGGVIAVLSWLLLSR